MNTELHQTITLIKKELDKTHASIIFAQLKSGIKLGAAEIEKLGVYSEFLDITNGARFGAIDLWSYDDLTRNQFVLHDRQNSKESLISIGQILYEPIILDINDQKVYTFKLDDDSDIPMTFIGGFDYFLRNYVFGERYGEILPDYDSDEWIIFLKDLKIIEQ
jgi:hypothetical protein